MFKGNIREQENILFEEYRKKNPQMSNIVIDGLACEEEYFEAEYRIVYILKEVNGGENWDLRDFVNQGGRVPTWDNVARWTEGIFNLHKEKPWGYWQENNEARRKSILKKIGVINLKKNPGGYTSDPKEIEKAAKDNGELVKKQLELYKPDLIICGGTLWDFINACYKKDEYQVNMTSRGIEYIIDNNGIAIIGYTHPQARVKDQILHYALMDAMKEIIEEI